MPEDARIEPRATATLALAVRRSYHLARSHPRSDRYHTVMAIEIIFKNSSFGDADKSFLKDLYEIYCDGCTTGLPAAWLDSSHHT